MTADQQKRCMGISADAYEDLVIIDADRSFLSLTPREAEVFALHVLHAGRLAKRAKTTKETTEAAA